MLVENMPYKFGVKLLTRAQPQVNLVKLTPVVINACSYLQIYHTYIQSASYDIQNARANFGNMISNLSYAH